MSEQRQIVCPACQSKVSADGKIVERSAQSRAMEQVPALVAKLRARLEALEREFVRAKGT